MNIYDKLGEKTSGIKARVIKKTDEKHLKTAPAIFIDAKNRMDEAEARAEHLENELVKSLGRPTKLKLIELLNSHLQTRKLDLNRVNELAEHLALNELTTPIVVRPSDTCKDKFEIIAGHHRVEAFKQLGRTEIEAIIRPMDDQEAQKRIFFDNLMAPDLPDFERYKGFAAIRQRTGQSHNALAEEAGISKTLVTFLFAFEKLPRKALDLLEINPTLIGATAAQKIASLKADEDKVVLGLEKIIAGQLDQTKIIAFLKQDGSTKPVPQFVEHIVKQGEQTICTLSTKSNKSITLTFGKNFNAEDWHQKLIAFIEKESGSSLN